MNLLLTVITVALLLAYAIYTYLIRRGLAFTASQKVDRNIAFSIIVAARNEEISIRKCLKSILLQGYPSDRFEVILVNDRSIDSTLKIAKDVQQQYPQLKIISLTENTSEYRNKKNALRHGIAISNNEVLAFTDADCVVPPNWLSEISKLYTDDVGMVVGSYRNNQIDMTNATAKLFFSFEDIKKFTFCAASIGLQQAYLGSGANISYRKEVYEQVGGFDRIKSAIGGDDDLFVQLVQQTTDWNIRFLHPVLSHTMTNPPKTVMQFIRQRIRYISTGRYYSNTLVNIFYSIYYLLLLAIAIAFFISPLFAISAYTIKFILDYLQISPQAKVFHFTMSRLVLGNIVYDLYYLLMSPAGHLLPPTWK